MKDKSLVGWRAMVGLILPKLDFISEQLFHSVFPNGISVITTRIFRRRKKFSVEAAKEYFGQIERAVMSLPTDFLDLVVFHDTAGSFVGGPAYEERIVSEIEEKARAPAITTSRAVVNSLNLLKVRKIVVCTAYVEEINKKEKEYLEAFGFEVIKIKSIGVTVPLSRIISPEDVALFARREDVPEADCVFISCTSLRSQKYIDVLENDIQKPVISSSTATLWHAMRVLGIRDQIEGYGRLLKM